MSFLWSNPDGLPSYAESDFLYLLQHYMICHSLTSNFFLPTCSLYISYTSLPYVLLNSWVLTFLEALHPQLPISRILFPLILLWLPSVSPSTLYSYFIFFVRLSSFPRSNQCPLSGTHICLSIHLFFCHHLFIVFATISHTVYYIHLSFVFLNLNINPVKEMILITFKKLIT